MKKALSAALLLALILSACDNEFGVLKSIQEEEKQDKNSVFYKTSVTQVLKHDTRYYARMNGLWSRPASGGDWSAVSGLPSGDIAGIASDGTTLYAALLGSGVYSSADGASWTQVTGTAGLFVDGIWAAGSTIFFQDHDPGANAESSETSDDEYTLYFVNAGTATTTGIGARVGLPFRGAAAADGNLWAISGTTLFTGASGAAMNTIAPGAPTTKTLSALSANAGGDLYLGTADGFVYRREADTDSWSAGLEVLADTAVTALLEVPVPSLRLLAGFGGAGGEGYYEIDTSASSLGAVVAGGGSGALLSNDTGYETSLADTPLNAFFLDDLSAGSYRILAAATASGLPAGSGLYSNLFSAGAWGGWISE